jgi:hypothetical protein
MRRRLVLWGSNAEDKKILVGLELLDGENKVKLYVIPEEQATEIFYTQMMNMWRDGNEILFPEETETIERDLSVVEDLLPENMKVDRTDIILRAKAEWHFVVLSAKLYEIYKTEIEDLKETVENLSDYDDKIWEELKGFWSKVQDQVKEKNMFKEHAESLKNKTNEAFNNLKVLRKDFEKKLREESKARAEVFKTELAGIEEKIEKGLGLKPLFEELKDIQNRFRKEKFDRRDQNSLWGKIDGLFKVIKEKRYGEKGKSGNSPLERLERRYNGLLAAIKKMKRSMDRDENEMDFQKRRIDKTDGQLELQLRQAKIKMIEERVSSKQIKLDDMLKTKGELEAKLEAERKKQEARKHQEEVRKVKEKMKEKIAEDIAVAQSDIDPNVAEKLEKAAEEIAESKQSKKVDAPITKKVKGELANKKQNKEEIPAEKEYSNESSPAEKSKEEPSSSGIKKEEASEEKIEEKESMMDSIKETISESLEDIVDNVKAVAEVVENRVEDFIEDLNKGEEE